MIITFKFETQYGVYSDALHLNDDHNFTDAEIEVMKQERLNNWIAYIESPKETTLEESIEI
jgi:hypothetical protein